MRESTPDFPHQYAHSCDPAIRAFMRSRPDHKTGRSDTSRSTNLVRLARTRGWPATRGSPGRSRPSFVTRVRLFRGEAALAGGFSYSCRRVSASRRVDRTIRRQPSFMRQRSSRNPETLHGKDDNPPGHVPDTATLLPGTKTLPDTGAPGSAHPKRASPLSHCRCPSAAVVTWVWLLWSEVQTASWRLSL